MLEGRGNFSKRFDVTSGEGGREGDKLHMYNNNNNREEIMHQSLEKRYILALASNIKNARNLKLFSRYK